MPRRDSGASEITLRCSECRRYCRRNIAGNDGTGVTRLCHKPKGLWMGAGYTAHR
jgi:hypothetical protein